MDHGRCASYRAFYQGGPAKTPIALVVGNCQAESVRIVLASSKSFPYTLVRVPPVHELTLNDMYLLRTLLKRTETLLTQPVRADLSARPTRPKAGEPVDEQLLWKEHTRWYERHPQWIETGISRHREQMDLLGR